LQLLVFVVLLKFFFLEVFLKFVARYLTLVQSTLDVLQVVL
jgi:hypothetical protein